MMAATDSEDSSLQVGPPRQAASPHPTRPSTVSRRTKAKFTASRTVNDILCGRATGMSAWITRTLAIFMRPSPRESQCSRPEDVGVGVDAPDRNRPGGDGPLSPLLARPSSTNSADDATPRPGTPPGRGRRQDADMSIGTGKADAFSFTPVAAPTPGPRRRGP